MAVLWIFVCVLHGAIPAATAWPPHWKVGVVCIPANVFRKLNSYQSFQDAGNRDVSRLRKTELKLQFLCEVVIGTVLRRLFYDIVHPKALLSLGSSSLFFTCGGMLMYENSQSQF